MHAAARLQKHRAQDAAAKSGDAKEKVRCTGGWTPAATAHTPPLTGSPGEGGGQAGPAVEAPDFSVVEAKALGSGGRAGRRQAVHKGRMGG